MQDINTALDLVTGHILMGIQDALEGIPISIGRCSSDCSPDLTTEESVTIIQVFDKAGQRVNTSFRFIRGDFWNSLPDKYGHRTELIRKAHPKADQKEIARIYQEWKICGTVAKRWDVSQRNPKYSWQFYRTHYPNRVLIEKRKNTYPISELGTTYPILPGKHSSNVGTATINRNTQTVFLDIQYYDKTIPVRVDISSAQEEEDSEKDDFSEMKV